MVDKNVGLCYNFAYDGGNMMISMLADVFTDINAWIKSWDTTTFALITIVLVLFLGLAVIAFVKKAVSDKPAIKVGKIIIIALFLFLIIYICSVH